MESFNFHLHMIQMHNTEFRVSAIIFFGLPENTYTCSQRPASKKSIFGCKGAKNEEIH